VLAEQFNDRGVAQHRTPSGSPGLSPSSPQQTASRQSRGAGLLFLCSVLAEKFGEQNFAHREVTNCVKPKGWRIVGHNESEGMEFRNRTQLHWAKVSTSSKPVSLHALIGECDSGVPESQTMAGNSTVHIGTWESHIVPDGSFQQAEEARRKYGDMAVGPDHSRGVGGVEQPTRLQSSW